MKKVPIRMKPRAPADEAHADAWVQDHKPAATPAEAEPMKRLTIDVPLSLHQRVKSQCALRNLKMSDVVRELLEKHFSPE